MDLQYIGKSLLAIPRCATGYVTKAKKSNSQGPLAGGLFSLFCLQQAVVIWYLLHCTPGSVASIYEASEISSLETCLRSQQQASRFVLHLNGMMSRDISPLVHKPMRDITFSCLNDSMVNSRISTSHFYSGVSPN